MPLNIITPKGASVVGYGADRHIVFPAFTGWETVDQSIARGKGENRIAPPDFEQRIRRLLNGEQVDLTSPGQMRFGAAFALTVNGRPTYGKFDDGHPLRANQLTPAAGAFDPGSDLNFMAAAMRELAEEMVVGPPGCVGLWSLVNGEPIVGHAELYARQHGMPFDRTEIALIRRTTSDLHWTINFGNERVQALIAWEPDTSDVEIIVTGEVTLPDGWWIADGELVGAKGGSVWRKQPIVSGCYERYPLTTKAEMVLQAHALGFRIAE